MAWNYCVHAPDWLRCYRNKTTAMRSAKSRARRSRGQEVWVQRVKTNKAGVHDQYAKGARVVWTNRT